MEERKTKLTTLDRRDSMFLIKHCMKNPTEYLIKLMFACLIEDRYHFKNLSMDMSIAQIKWKDKRLSDLYKELIADYYSYYNGSKGFPYQKLVNISVDEEKTVDSHQSKSKEESSSQDMDEYRAWIESVKSYLIQCRANNTKSLIEGGQCFRGRMVFYDNYEEFCKQRLRQTNVF